jgi:hypothetical protein
MTSNMEWDTNAAFLNPIQGQNQIVYLNPSKKLFVRNKAKQNTIASEIVDLSLLPVTASWWNPRIEVSGNGLIIDLISGVPFDSIKSEFVEMSIVDSLGVLVSLDSFKVTSRVTTTRGEGQLTAKFKLVNQFGVADTLSVPFVVKDWKSVKIAAGSASSWMMTGLGAENSSFAKLGLSGGVVYRWSESSTYNQLLGKYVSASDRDLNVPGHGYWVYAESSLSTQVLPAQKAVTINLDTMGTAWNMIANPYAFPLSVDQILVKNPNAQFWFWDKDKAKYDTLSSDGQLVPYGAYWILAKGMKSLEFEPIVSRALAVKSNGISTQKPSLRAMMNQNWKLNLVLQSGLFESTPIELGRGTHSATQLPDPQGQYLKLDIVENTHLYRSLLKNESSPTWTVRSGSTVSGLSSAQLNIEGLEGLDQNNLKLIWNSGKAWKEVTGPLELRSTLQGQTYQLKVVPKATQMHAVIGVKQMNQIISLDLPYEYLNKRLVFTLSDLQGRVLRTINKTVESQEVSLNMSDYGVKGLVFYSIQVGESVVNGKVFRPEKME